MTNIFEKFNEQVDLEGMKADIDSASENSNDFEEVPTGTYEVVIEKLEQVMTKKAPARPMMTVWFTVLEGKYKNQKIFYNQLLTSGFPIHICNEFLRSLDSGIEIEFKDYVQYQNLILDVAEAIEDKKEYALEKTVNKKGYDVYTIKQVFDKQ